uniref:DNA-damage-repair/toleration protein DRT102 n=1 Tax=Tanacetum cinerariifolium TaxID=118510 RepID=A0A6L2NAJ5_TANCI|nr:DNA-damage-repair/toleration protein DRT102 [Tanacetum cinerariifolium]
MSQTTTPHRLKFIAGADPFGAAIKDTLVTHLRSLNIEVEDIGTDNYYTIGEKVGKVVSSTLNKPDTDTRGLVACGTGVGVAIFANKYPGVYAATCLTPGDAVNARSINNSNVIAVSGMSTDPETAVEMLDKFLNTPFKSPCPASNSEAWPENVQSFLDGSVAEMSKIGKNESVSNNDNGHKNSSCAICELAEGREFTPVGIMPGGVMKIVRENPTSAIVRVKYLEETEIFIRWDGGWDIELDEDLATAIASLEKEA